MFGSLGPPTLVKQSCKMPGLASDPEYPFVPHSRSEVVFTFPASNSKPETRTPSTFPTAMQGYPLVAINVAKPKPKTIVFAWLTLRLSLNLYWPGVKTK